MSHNQKSQKDFVFILSFAAIILIAVFVVYDKMQEFGITEFLRENGYALINQVTNDDEKKRLASLYNQLLEKVENKELSPDQVEYLASDIINLSNSRERLSREEVEKLFQQALEKINSETSQVRPKREAEWQQLSQRLKLIDDLKKNVSLAKPGEPIDKKQEFEFVFVVDESLNVVVDPDIQKELDQKSFQEIQTKLAVLEREKALKWSRQIKDSVDFVNQKIKIEMEALNEDLEKMKLNIEIPDENMKNARILVMPDSTRK